MKFQFVLNKNYIFKFIKHNKCDFIKWLTYNTKEVNIIIKTFILNVQFALWICELETSFSSRNNDTGSNRWQCFGLVKQYRRISHEGCNFTDN